MSDPVLDALQERAGDTPASVDSGDPVIDALHARASGKTYTEDSPKPTHRLAGVGEAALQAVTGGVGQLGGGLTYLGTLAAGGGTDAAKAVQESTQNALTYQPRTEEGQRYAGNVGEAASYLGQKEGEWAGPKVAELTGSPALGAAANTLLQAAQYILPLKGKGLLKGGAEEAPKGSPEPSPQAAPGASTAAPEAAAPKAPEAPPKFEEAPATAPEGKTLPPEEQARRAQILQKIGLNETRQSAITGDSKAAATEFQTSRLDNGPGDRLSTLIDKERESLHNYSEKLVQDTGGSLGTDQSALLARGEKLNTPLEGLEAHFDKAVKDIYDTTRERLGNTPVSNPALQKLLSTNSEFTRHTDTLNLRNAIKDRAKELGIMDKDGNLQPTTVDNIENLRQYVGQSYTFHNARAVKLVKDALDDDVTQAAGEDVFKASRALRTQQANTLEDPKGIARLLDREGINRAVPIEKMADTITTMPVAQLKHVVDTYRSMPDELKSGGQDAINEIRAQFANKVSEAGNKTKGQWNAKGVTQYLNANSARMAQVFNPEELQNFKDLNDAGHILKADQSYPGASVQEHNLVKQGVMGAVRAGGTAAGGAMAGGLGAIAGQFIGDTAVKRFSERAAMKTTEEKIVKLNDLLKKQQ